LEFDLVVKVEGIEEAADDLKEARRQRDTAMEAAREEAANSRPAALLAAINAVEQKALNQSQALETELRAAKQNRNA
jgi:hypothetical protein